MRLITQTTYAEILLTEGIEEVHIDQCEDLKLVIKADKRLSASLFVTYDGSRAKADVELQLCEGCQVSVLFWNQVTESLEFDVQIVGERDVQVHLGIGDLSKATARYHMLSHLNHSGMDVHTTTVCRAAEKHWVMEMKHDVPHTSGLMENFAVVEQDGAYYAEASGQIVKGAYDSTSHQSTRVLTMSQEQRSEVLPILLIDENEVKASHATTLGQPDENQLYYLQSRGLSRSAALGLLTFGYLMPITAVIDDAEIRERLQKQIEEKVIVHD